jgi:hypothetical protein
MDACTTPTDNKWIQRRAREGAMPTLARQCDDDEEEEEDMFSPKGVAAAPPPPRAELCAKDAVRRELPPLPAGAPAVAAWEVAWR